MGQNKLKELRLQKDITQTRLSVLSGYSRQWINRVEKGTKKPSRRFQMHISKVLGASMKEVFGG